MDHFDCFLNPNPVQVLSKNDGKNYSVSGLNVVTHVYDTIYNMGTYISDTYTNAVALYIDPEADSPRDARNYARARAELAPRASVEGRTSRKLALAPRELLGS